MDILFLPIKYQTAAIRMVGQGHSLLPEQFQPGAKILELASAPFGFAPEDCKKQGLEWIDGGALPGKWMPETAAKLIGDFILKEMEGNG